MYSAGAGISKPECMEGLWTVASLCSALIANTGCLFVNQLASDLLGAAKGQTAQGEVCKFVVTGRLVIKSDHGAVRNWMESCLWARTALRCTCEVCVY